MSLADDPMSMTITQQMVMAHYNQTWGIATEVLRYAFSEKPQDAPFVAEFFVGTDEEPLYVYATIGMSDAPQPGVPDGPRVELFVYTNRPLPDLKLALASLAIYPFQRQLAFAPLDTVYGSRGFAENSALSSVLLALPTREPEEFAIVDLGDYQAQMLMVTPISEAERQYCAARGPLELLGVFVSQQVDLADLQRASAI